MDNKNIHCITLKPISIKRVKNYIIWFNKQNVRKYLLPQTPRKKERIEKMINNWITDKTCSYYSIYIKKQKRYIGHVGAKIDQNKNEAIIGIVIGEEEYWGKGIALKALFKIEKKLKKLKIKKIKAEVHNKNNRSIKLFYKFGSKKTKLKPQNKKHIVFVKDII